MKYINQTKMADKLENAYGAIYMWINLHNNHKYIGQAMVHRLDAREHEHTTMLDSCPLINKAIKKYGHFNFLRIIIDVAYSAEELNEKEMYWIAKYNTFEGEGYNCTKGGEGGFNTGKKHHNFKGYVLAINFKKQTLVGVYEGVSDTIKSLSTDSKKLTNSGVSQTLNGKCYYHQHQGYVFKWVDADVYDAYQMGDTALADDVVEEYKKEAIKAKKQKEREAYVKKMENKKFILLASCVPNKEDKVFKNQTEVANFLNISQAHVCRSIKNGKPNQDYIISYINFEEYEALAN